MTILTLHSVQNTFVSKLWPNKNYKCYPTLFTGENFHQNSICRSLFKFDIHSIKNSLNINNANLQLYIYRNDVPSITKPTSVHSLLSPFDEKTVTYSTQPMFDMNPSAILGITSEKDTFVKWDITSLLINWLKGDSPNYGLLLTGLESQYSLTGFFSSKHKNPLMHPVITIEYSSDKDFIEYPPEKVISSDQWNYTPPIPLSNRVGTFGIENSGTSNSAYVKLQLSSDGQNWLDDCPVYMSITEFSPGNNAVLTTNGYMSYVRAAYKSTMCNKPAELIIYATTKS
jgi:hypothetical protein